MSQSEVVSPVAAGASGESKTKRKVESHAAPAASLQNAAEVAPNFAPPEQFPADMVREVAQLLSEAELGEVTIQSVGAKLRLQRAAPVAPQAVPIVNAAPFGVSPSSVVFPLPETAGISNAEASNNATNVATSSATNAGASAINEANGAATLTVNAPCVGMFRTPAQPLEVSAVVKRKQLLGVVESLNVPHELYAPGAAKIVAWLAQDGQAVEWDQPLLEIQPLSEEEVR